MLTVLTVLIVSGIALLVSAVYPAWRPFPYVTRRGRALRLKQICDKLTIHLETAVDSTEKCYQILCVIVGTTVANERYLMQIAAKEPAWNRARRWVLFNSHRGRSMAEALLRKEPEPGAMLARQRFKSISETCAVCPMLKLHSSDLPARCPSMDAFTE